jgi:hypothetical protein
MHVQAGWDERGETVTVANDGLGGHLAGQLCGGQLARLGRHRLGGLPVGRGRIGVGAEQVWDRALALGVDHALPGEHDLVGRFFAAVVDIKRARRGRDDEGARVPRHHRVRGRIGVGPRGVGLEVRPPLARRGRRGRRGARGEHSEDRAAALLHRGGQGLQVVHAVHAPIVEDPVEGHDLGSRLAGVVDQVAEQLARPGPGQARVVLDVLEVRLGDVDDHDVGRSVACVGAGARAGVVGPPLAALEDHGPGPGGDCGAQADRAAHQRAGDELPRPRGQGRHPAPLPASARPLI